MGFPASLRAGTPSGSLWQFANDSYYLVEADAQWDLSADFRLIIISERTKRRVAELSSEDLQRAEFHHGHQCIKFVLSSGQILLLQLASDALLEEIWGRFFAAKRSFEEAMRKRAGVESAVGDEDERERLARRECIVDDALIDDETAAASLGGDEDHIGFDERDPILLETPEKKKKPKVIDASTPVKIAQSVRFDSVLVSRGNEVDAVRMGRDGGSRVVGSFHVPEDHGVVNEVLPADGGSHLLMLPAAKGGEHDGFVFDVDLHRPDVVSLFRMQSSDVPIPASGIFSDQMYADDSKIFGALNQKAIFQVDRREKDGVVALHPFTAGSFMCATATDHGQVVSGSKDGALRFFRGIPDAADPMGSKRFPNRARNLIPGLGDPVLHVDVTGDRRWVLCTCARYLLLFESGGELGDLFEKTVAKASKPLPIKLTLTAEDWSAIGPKSTFGDATFNRGAEEKRGGEGHGVYFSTAIGRFLVSWNLATVVLTPQGRWEYDMKKMSVAIAAQSFHDMGKDTSSSSAPVIAADTSTSGILIARRTKRSPERRTMKYAKGSH